MIAASLFLKISIRRYQTLSKPKVWKKSRF